MTAFYDEMAEVADEMLAEFGQGCTLSSVTIGDYDPATGGASTTATSQTVTGAIFDYPQRFIDGTLILTGDKRVLVSPIGVTGAPKPGDTLTAGGIDYRVVDAKATAPAGIAVLWTLQVRK